MAEGTALTAIIICSIALPAQGSNPEQITFTVHGPSKELARVISWLPADTETITVARGPFVLATSRIEQNENKDRAISGKELAGNFEELPLALLQFKNGLLAKRQEGKTINLAIEGARHFRSPAGLGEMPFEGCAIAVFADNLRSEIGSFTKDSRSSTLK